MNSQEGRPAIVLPVGAEGVAGVFLWEVVCGEKVSGLTKTLVTAILCSWNKSCQNSSSLNKEHHRDTVCCCTLGLLSQMGGGCLLSSELGGSHGGGSLPPGGWFVRLPD